MAQKVADRLDLEKIKKYARYRTEDVEKVAHPSECVRDLSYDIQAQDLTINFWQRGTYVYHNVPIDVYANLNAAESRGTYFNLYIRDAGFSYERIS